MVLLKFDDSSFYQCVKFGKLIIAAQTSWIKNEENSGKIGIVCETMKLAVDTIGIHFIVH